jgi:hypothetical protein
MPKTLALALGRGERIGMVENGSHIALLIWEYSLDPDSPEILFEERNHLTVCQDCIALLWMCRGSASLDDVRERLRERGVTAD